MRHWPVWNMCREFVPMLAGLVPGRACVADQAHPGRRDRGRAGQGRQGAQKRIQGCITPKAGTEQLHTGTAGSEQGPFS